METKNGYIYCFMNESMRGVYKIGMTERTPLDRLEEANKSNTWKPPTPYKIYIAKYVTNPRDKEKYLHKILESYNCRVNNDREFFKFENSEIINYFFELMDGELWNNKEYIEEDNKINNYSYNEMKDIVKEYDTINNIIRTNINIYFYNIKKIELIEIIKLIELHNDKKIVVTNLGKTIFKNEDYNKLYVTDIKEFLKHHLELNNIDYNYNQNKNILIHLLFTLEKYYMNNTTTKQIIKNIDINDSDSDSDDELLNKITKNNKLGVNIKKIYDENYNFDVIENDRFDEMKTVVVKYDEINNINRSYRIKKLELVEILKIIKLHHNRKILKTKLGNEIYNIDDYEKFYLVDIKIFLKEHLRINNIKYNINNKNFSILKHILITLEKYYKNKEIDNTIDDHDYLYFSNSYTINNKKYDNEYCDTYYNFINNLYNHVSNKNDIIKYTKIKIDLDNKYKTYIYNKKHKFSFRKETNDLLYDEIINVCIRNNIKINITLINTLKDYEKIKIEIK